MSLTITGVERYANGNLAKGAAVVWEPVSDPLISEEGALLRDPITVYASQTDATWSVTLDTPESGAHKWLVRRADGSVSPPLAISTGGDTTLASLLAATVHVTDVTPVAALLAGYTSTAGINALITTGISDLTVGTAADLAALRALDTGAVATRLVFVQSGAGLGFWRWSATYAAHDNTGLAVYPTASLATTAISVGDGITAVEGVKYSVTLPAAYVRGTLSVVDAGTGETMTEARYGIVTGDAGGDGWCSPHKLTAKLYFNATPTGAVTGTFQEATAAGAWLRVFDGPDISPAWFDESWAIDDAAFNAGPALQAAVTEATIAAETSTRSYDQGAPAFIARAPGGKIYFDRIHLRGWSAFRGIGPQTHLIPTYTTAGEYCIEDVQYGTETPTADQINIGDFIIAGDGLTPWQSWFNDANRPDVGGIKINKLHSGIIENIGLYNIKRSGIYIGFAQDSTIRNIAIRRQGEVTLDGGGDPTGGDGLMNYPAFVLDSDAATTNALKITDIRIEKCPWMIDVRGQGGKAVNRIQWHQCKFHMAAQTGAFEHVSSPITFNTGGTHNFTNLYLQQIQSWKAGVTGGHFDVSTTDNLEVIISGLEAVGSSNEAGGANVYNDPATSVAHLSINGCIVSGVNSLVGTMRLSEVVANGGPYTAINLTNGSLRGFWNRDTANGSTDVPVLIATGSVLEGLNIGYGVDASCITLGEGSTLRGAVIHASGTTIVDPIITGGDDCTVDDLTITADAEIADSAVELGDRARLSRLDITAATNFDLVTVGDDADCTDLRLTNTRAGTNRNLLLAGERPYIARFTVPADNLSTAYPIEVSGDGAIVSGLRGMANAAASGSAVGLVPPTGVAVTSIATSGAGPYTCTVETGAAHGLTVGMYVVLDGVDVDDYNLYGDEAAANTTGGLGPHEVLTVADTTHFTFETPRDAGAATGGTVTRTLQGLIKDHIEGLSYFTGGTPEKAARVRIHGRPAKDVTSNYYDPTTAVFYRNKEAGALDIGLEFTLDTDTAAANKVITLYASPTGDSSDAVELDYVKELANTGVHRRRLQGEVPAGWYFMVSYPVNTAFIEKWLLRK